MTENQLIGFQTLDDKESMCQRCGSIEDLIICQMDDKIKSLPVIKQFILCKHCCTILGIQLPKHIFSVRL